MMIKIEKKDELYYLTACSGELDEGYVTDDALANPVVYESKAGHRMIEYNGLDEEELRNLTIGQILKDLAR